MTKTKKIAIAATVIAALIFAFFFFSIWSAQKAAQGAVDAYNSAVEKYNAEIEPYNKAVNEIASENDELQKVLDRAKADLDSGAKAYEPDTEEILGDGLKKAQKLFVEVPVLIDPFDIMQISGSFSRKELDRQRQEAEASLEAVKAAEEKVPEIPEVPDFAEAKKELLEKCAAFEKSVQKLKNVTSPQDSFVEERLRKIDTVAHAGAVTPKYDPNGLLGKKGGYTGCVYFLDERVDRALLPEDALHEIEAEASDEEKSSAGSTEGAAEGSSAGSTERSTEGAADGSSAGSTEGAAEGSSAGSTERSTEGAADGSSAGLTEGAAEGSSAGSTEGTAEGSSAGSTEGVEEDSSAGSTEGAADGSSAGTGETAVSAGATEKASDSETAEKSGTGENTASEAAGTGETMASEHAETGGTAADTAKEETKEQIGVVMIGTAGGGAVEIFSSKEDAEARMEYLAFFDGSVMAAGAYDIEGTCVIRASKYLSEDQQKELIKTVREALLQVD